VAIAKLLKF